jgi:hypothetical protein
MNCYCPVSNNSLCGSLLLSSDSGHVSTGVAPYPRVIPDTIQGVSRLVDITAGGDFLGLCDQKSSYKHVSDVGRLQSYDRLKLRIEDDDY